jgi:hypothetical protein
MRAGLVVRARVRLGVHAMRGGVLGLRRRPQYLQIRLVCRRVHVRRWPRVCTGQHRGWGRPMCARDVCNRRCVAVRAVRQRWGVLLSCGSRQQRRGHAVPDRDVVRGRCAGGAKLPDAMRRWWILVPWRVPPSQVRVVPRRLFWAAGPQLHERHVCGAVHGTARHRLRRCHHGAGSDEHVSCNEHTGCRELRV